LPHNKHFLLTCKRLLLIFLHGRHAAEMPNRYVAIEFLQKQIMPNFVLDLLIGSVTGLIAAVFAVRISLHKFASQKWWERREEAYAKIVGILSTIKVYLGKWEEDEFNIRKLDQEGKRELYQKMREEREKIELVASEGAFRVSEKSNEALNELVKSLNRFGDHPIDAIQNHYEAIRECLKIIKSEAEKDLRIKRKWYKF